ncbi:MAG: glucodextranase DOMON-like domain-containing protein [Acidobacteriota bacterium]
MRGNWKRWTVALAAGVLFASAVVAQEVAFKDPTGDDNGPGTYTYPTDTVYKPGSFDLTGLTVTEKGGKVTFDVGVNSTLEDPWRMGTGFSVQMVFVFVKTGTAGGNTKGIPGTNVQFAADSGWDKCVILSPQGASRVKAEVDSKAADLKSSIVIPTRVKGSGRTISATVDKKELGDGDVTKWGYQVIMQSNEGFPDAKDLLTRKVNEFEGQHRFGGGNDGDCDPHVMDILAGNGTGDKAEIGLQHEMLKYECNADGTPKALATLKMVYKK